MKHIPLLLVFLVLLLLTLAIIFPAGPPRGYQATPNTPADNECYTGGELYGRCHTDEMWLTGWYLARYKAGFFARYQIPDWAQWALPTEAGPAPTVTAMPVQTQ
jgi:hypothetical protein